MTLKYLLGAVAAVSLAAGPVFAQEAAPAPAPAAAPAASAYTPVAAKGDIIQTLQAAGQFKTLLRALDMTSLPGLLKRPQPITFFAPTDAAFAADPGLQAILQPGNPQLQTRLAYLIFNGALDYESTLKGKAGPVPGAMGSIYFDGAATPNKVNDANLLQPELKVSNGSLYIIDRVISPGFKPAPAAAPEAAAPAQ